MKSAVCNSDKQNNIILVYNKLTHFIHEQVPQAPLKFGTFHFGKVLLDVELWENQTESYHSYLNFELRKLEKGFLFELF